MDLGRYSQALQLGQDGTWTVERIADDVSYPNSGHNDCFQVEDASFWFQHRNTCLTAVVAHFPPPGPIFDVGGGNGVVAAALSARGWPVVLVEPGDAGISHALRRGLQNVVRATFEDAAFTAGVLPAVGLFDVLEHIADDIDFLRKVGSKLVADGVIYATVPAFRWLWSDDDEQAGHFRRYTKREVVGAFQAAGFRTTYVSYIFAPLPFVIFLMRSIPSRFRILRMIAPGHTVRAHVPGGLLQGIVASLLRLERRRVPNRQIPFGSSILLVAEWPGAPAASPAI